MLKGIPDILSPELLMVLDEMGHGDTICIGDGNFPAESMGKDAIVVRADGHGVAELLDAILQLFPLDTYVDHPVKLMKVVDGLDIPTPEIWGTFEKIVEKYDERGKSCIGFVERFDYYDLSRQCYCILATGEKAIYANVLLQKGIVNNK